MLYFHVEHNTVRLFFAVSNCEDLIGGIIFK